MGREIVRTAPVLVAYWYRSCSYLALTLFLGSSYVEGLGISSQLLECCGKVLYCGIVKKILQKYEIIHNSQNFYRLFVV